MKAALWTPAAGSVAAAAPLLARQLELEILGASPARRPRVDVDLYHVSDSSDHGFVYRALLERPGVVVLERWNLHGLVFTETAGRGQPDLYSREARRAHGDVGSFVARQVLAGLAGALPRLVPLNQRVLDASLALVSFDAETAARAAALLPDRSVLLLAEPRSALDEASAALADALVRLAGEVAPRVEPVRRSRSARQARERTPLGLALAELAWTARELGLARPPHGTEALVAPLFQGRR
jgi:hypothetical protein